MLLPGCRDSDQLPASSQFEISDKVAGDISFRSFQNPDKTWGFTVFINSKPFRHYNNIPFKNNKSGFISKIEADKVAELFTTMIRHGDTSPKLDRRLIDSMKLTINKKRKLTI